MTLVDKISALATRIGTELKAKYTLPGGGIPVADLSTDARAVSIVIWQNYGIQAVGIGQQDIGYPVSHPMRVTGVRYWCKTAGSGVGASVAELRLNGIAGGNTITSSSATPAVTTPTTATPSADLDTGDLIWVYQSAIQATAGVQLVAEIIGYQL
ncbi:hypothetical protein [Nocardia salmonicida]|uniref:hypothetical protein n=1 Tax=Nocardia salmonicida TaxID=53431 RepID=UPI002E2C5DED|nr:hypothetical protein [Nocardia salmonicida]